MKRLIAALGIGLAVGFGAGRVTSGEEQKEREEEEHAERWLASHPSAPDHPPRVVVTAPSRMTPSAADAPTEAPAIPSEPACHDVAVFSQRCASRLKDREAELSLVEELRTEREGKPIPAKASPTEPRFGQPALTAAMQQGFAQTRVPGAVDGVDCSEYPCILFGRIQGAEDQMEKLEKAKSLAAYEEDILTVLIWSATDEAAKEAADARGEDDSGLEQSLFAVAIYPKKDAAELGDNLDRRIRTRTAELWNTTAPSDETAAH